MATLESGVLDPEMLAWMFAGDPDRAFIRDLFELRGVIEPAAAEFAARRRTDDQLAVMDTALGEMRRYGLSTPEGRAADQRAACGQRGPGRRQFRRRGGQLDHHVQASQKAASARSAARSPIRA